MMSKSSRHAQGGHHKERAKDQAHGYAYHLDPLALDLDRVPGVKRHGTVLLKKHRPYEKAKNQVGAPGFEPGTSTTPL